MRARLGDVDGLLVGIAHGNATSQSRYVRTIECSVDCLGHVLEAAELLRALLRDLFGHLGLAIASRELVELRSSVSSLAELLLDRLELLAKEYSRCRSSILPCVCSPISFDSFSTSMRWVRNSITRSRRSRR